MEHEKLPAAEGTDNAKVMHHLLLFEWTRAHRYSRRGSPYMSRHGLTTSVLADIAYVVVVVFVIVVVMLLYYIMNKILAECFII